MSDAMDPGAMGVAHLLSQSSGMGLLPLVLLVLMSVGSGYYLLLKSWTGWRERRQGTMTHLQRRTAAVVDSGRRSVGFISRKSAGGGAKATAAKGGLPPVRLSADRSKCIGRAACSV